MLETAAKRFGVSMWAYCLMPNHIHLVAVPEEPHSLGYTFGVAEARYSRFINQRQGCTGHLWQARFFSAPLDAQHAYNACRYTLLNPVRAGLVATAEEWEHSSARQHLGEETPRTFLDLRALDRHVSAWCDFLGPRENETDFATKLRYATATGQALGSGAFTKAVADRWGEVAGDESGSEQPVVATIEEAQHDVNEHTPPNLEVSRRNVDA